jgi:hypothetical protein
MILRVLKGLGYDVHVAVNRLTHFSAVLFVTTIKRVRCIQETQYKTRFSCDWMITEYTRCDYSDMHGEPHNLTTGISIHEVLPQSVTRKGFCISYTGGGGGRIKCQGLRDDAVASVTDSGSVSIVTRLWAGRPRIHSSSGPHFLDFQPGSYVSGCFPIQIFYAILVFSTDLSVYSIVTALISRYCE